MAPRFLLTSLLSLLFLSGLIFVNTQAAVITMRTVQDIANPTEDGLSLKRAEQVNQIKLRVLPLGASITWGQNSASGNGYRKPLRDRLVSQGFDTDMVGSKKHGNMIDNEVEATPGHTIDQVKAAAQNSLQFKPNIVLINAGTNDCARNIDIPNAAKRMRSLIESIVHANGLGQTVIVLSTLLYSHETRIETNRVVVNRQYRDLVVAMKKEGVAIYLADMDPGNPAAGNGLIKYPVDYTNGNNAPDPTHPSESGYKKMADVWFQAIQVAANEKRIPNVLSRTSKL